MESVNSIRCSNRSVLWPYGHKTERFEQQSELTDSILVT